MGKFYRNINDGKYYIFEKRNDDYWIGIKDNANDNLTTWVSRSLNGDDRFYELVGKYNDAVNGEINQTWGLDKKNKKFRIPGTSEYVDLYYDPTNPTEYAYAKNGNDIYFVYPGMLWGTNHQKISNTDDRYSVNLNKYNAAKDYAEKHNGSSNYIVSSQKTTVTSNNNAASEPVKTTNANTKTANTNRKNVPKKAVTPVYNKEGLYLILYGDTLGKLAKQYNTTVDQLMLWNPYIKDANKIYTGKYLNVNGPLNIHTEEQTKKELKFNDDENAKAKKALDAYDANLQDLASSNSLLHHTLDNYFKLYINFSENGSALPRRKILRRTK